MSGVRETMLTVTIVIFGLHAGLYAAFAYSVLPGLRRADAAVGVVAMQRINVAIQNPLFLMIFAGGLVVGAITAGICWSGPLRWWVVAAVVLCLVGTLITIGINIPLNNALDGAGPVTGAAAERAWTDFAGPWARANIARAVVHTASFAVLVVGVVHHRG